MAGTHPELGLGGQIAHSARWLTPVAAVIAALVGLMAAPVLRHWLGGEAVPRGRGSSAGTDRPAG